MTEALDKHIKFMCIGMTNGTGYYGTGRTYDEAVANYIKSSGNKRFMCYMWTDDNDLPTSVSIGWRVTWKNSISRSILIQDNRLKKAKDKGPAQIGSEMT